MIPMKYYSIHHPKLLTKPSRFASLYFAFSIYFSNFIELDFRDVAW